MEKTKELKKRFEARGLFVEIKTKGGEGGRLFGSVTNKDIAAALEKQFKVKIDKKKIAMDNPIKQTGMAIVQVKLYSEITANLKINVTV